METLLEVLRKSEAFLASKGVPQPKLDAEWLLAHGLGCRRLDLFLQFDKPLASEVLDRLRPLVMRRGRREPLQHIIGSVEFAGVTLKCDRRALIPRPETEQLVELLLGAMGVAGQQPCGKLPPMASPRRLLDLGTGSGALALALAHYLPQAEVVAVDQSSEALALAGENADRLALAGRVQLRQTNWLEGIDGPFDLVVSNPPYLTEEELATAEPEVRGYEPPQALVAGPDGLRDLRLIMERALVVLAPGGWLALETGIAQHEALVAQAQALGYANWYSLPDLSHRPRFFLAVAPG